jgi:hypothetical protein
MPAKQEGAVVFINHSLAANAATVTYLIIFGESRPTYD